MALDISSNTHTALGNAVARPVVVAAPASPATAAGSDEKSHLTPIPKAEIKIDLERESQDVREAIGKLNDMMQAGARSVSFSLDEKLGRPIVYIKNAKTGEIVRQIPNEVVVRIAHNIEDLKGVLHNEKI